MTYLGEICNHKKNDGGDGNGDIPSIKNENWKTATSLSDSIDHMEYLHMEGNFAIWHLPLQILVVSCARDSPCILPHSTYGQTSGTSLHAILNIVFHLIHLFVSDPFQLLG